MKCKAVSRDIIFPALFSNISCMFLPWKTWSFGSGKLRKTLQEQKGSKGCKQKEWGVLLVREACLSYGGEASLPACHQLVGCPGGSSAKGGKGKQWAVVVFLLVFIYFVYAEANGLKSIELCVRTWSSAATNTRYPGQSAVLFALFSLKWRKGHFSKLRRKQSK